MTTKTRRLERIMMLASAVTILLVAAVAVICSEMVSAQDEPIYISGVVYDISGNGVAAAEIQVYLIAQGTINGVLVTNTTAYGSGMYIAYTELLDIGDAIRIVATSGTATGQAVRTVSAPTTADIVVSEPVPEPTNQTYTLTVAVKDRADQPLANIMVGPKVDGTVTFYETTGADGVVTLELQAGSWTIWADGLDYVAQDTQVTISDDKAIHITLSRDTAAPAPFLIAGITALAAVVAVLVLRRRF